MGNRNDFERVVFFILAAIIFFIALPAAVIFGLKHNAGILAYPKKIKWRVALTLSFIFCSILFLYARVHFKYVILLIPVLWGVAGALAVLLVPFYRRRVTRITTKYIKPLKSPKKSDSAAPGCAFIGESLVNGDQVFLEKHLRVMHTVIVGATGSGKTTVLGSLFEYDCEQKHPILIIDPKGNDETIELLKRKAVSCGVPEDKFKVFNLANPQKSLRYNPLKHGTATQIKDRLMGSLTWSEPFYKTQAELFLIQLLEICAALKKEISISKIIEAMEVKDFILDLKEELKKSGLSKELELRLNQNINAIAKISASDLSGLRAQLISLNPLEFDNLLSPDENAERIDLLEALNNAHILYFSLNVMNYGETAPVIGRLLLQELKSLTSQIHSKSVVAKNKYMSIFIDEFGSFAFKEFIDWQKMCRDVGFAIHLFFQGLADLNVVSPDFKSQVQQNCITKIILRCDDPEEADFWASVAGTKDAIEQSYQVEDSGFMQTRTGMGNQRNTKEMAVEHDVFKQISIGQAVLIQKSPHRIDLLNLYRSS